MKNPLQPGPADHSPMEHESTLSDKFTMPCSYNPALLKIVNDAYQEGLLEGKANA